MEIFSPGQNASEASQHTQGAAQHVAAQELSCGASWSRTFSPGAFFDATGALLTPRTFERYRDCSQTPTSEQVWRYVRSEEAQ